MKKVSENLTNQQKFIKCVTALSTVSISATCNSKQAKTNITPVPVIQKKVLIYYLSPNPVLSNLEERQLKAKMPIESMTEGLAERKEFTHLESFGRTLSGIAPWLEIQFDNALGVN